MFETARSKFATRMRRLLPVRTAHRFARQQDGAAAVEFALVAVPFLALLFALIETALVFFASQALEAATADSARLVMTGQAQTTAYKNSGATSFSQSDFHSAVCDHLAGGLFNCANIVVNVQSYNSFSAANVTPPVTNGAFDTSQIGYKTGNPGCIVTVQVFYLWPIYVSLLSDNLSNLTGGSRLLAATAAFRNEPYGPAGAC